MNKKYYTSDFRNSFPEWKKKRDPIMVRILYRPISFSLAAFFSNIGLTSNDVSNLSIIIGLTSCILFLIPNKICGIIGAFMLNLWITLDCTDGNIARTIHSLPYGDFLDSSSCYILVAFLFNILGFRSYYTDSIWFTGNVLIILFGAFGSTFDTLMRVIYQRYLVSSLEMGIKINKEYDLSKTSRINRIRSIIDLNVGIGGILPVMILLSVIFSFLDVIVVLWTSYFGVFCISSVIYFIYKATKEGNKFKND